MMRSNSLVKVVLGLGVLVCGVQALVAQERLMADKVVAVVGNSSILYSDLVVLKKQLAEQRREMGQTSDRDPLCEALEQMVIQKLLYNQSQIDSLKVSTLDLEAGVDQAIQQEIEDKGSVAALELYYRKPIFDIRTELFRRYEEMRYVGQMEQKIRSEVVITPYDVEKFYKRLPKDSLPIIPEQYVYSQILRYPPATEEAKLRTRQRLLELRERIMNGARFDALARMYSEDPGSASRGGEMEPTPKEGFVQPFSDALVKLKPGQVSEIVETEFGFHLIQLIEQRGSMYRCRHILMKPQFTVDELMVSFTTLDSLKVEIEAGNTTFVDAVKKFSQDKYSKENSGVATNLEMMEAMNNSNARGASNHFLKEELSPEVYAVIRKMKVGDISSAFASADMKGNQLSKIIRLDEIVPAHPANMKEDYLRIEELALEDKQNEVYEQWLAKKISSMYIRIDDEFKSCEFEHKTIVK